jgi:hypothetical protein
MPFCEECGTPLERTTPTCSKCGAPQEVAETGASRALTDRPSMSQRPTVTQSATAPAPLVRTVCESCQEPILGDGRFCRACESYLRDPSLGSKAGLFGRWCATVLDGFIGLFTLTIAIWIAFAKGTTPGHALMGFRIVRLDGSPVTFGTMFLRNIIGKFVSGMFVGLGYFWAIWDKDGQAWHDKIAGTLVLKNRPVRVERDR